MGKPLDSGSFTSSCKAQKPQEAPATCNSDLGVREPRPASSGPQVYPHAASTPAHALVRFPVQLNERWRVVDDPLQWILERTRGNPRKKSTGWEGRAFCATREALLRCIREYCGEVDPHAVRILEALPEHHRNGERAK